MNKQLRYMPIMRGQTQENLVLKSFDFGKNIFPCIEIIKEFGNSPRVLAKDSKPVKRKPFEEVYMRLISRVKALQVFVDLPVHLNVTRNMNKETIQFLTGIVGNREKRIEYLKKLEPISNRIVPMVSTYFYRTNEQNSIVLQEKSLRSTFNSLAFRTFPKSFSNDIEQIEKVFRPNDYLIMDWGDDRLNPEEDGDQQDILDRLAKFKGTIVVHKNPIPVKLTYKELENGAVVRQINNMVLDRFKDFGGTSFSDYAGIKRNEISESGGVSPGFYYYDAVDNDFYGFKGKEHKDIGMKLAEFEHTIVPDVLASEATQRMEDDELDFLSEENLGWQKIVDINNGGKGRSAALFKWIGMQHYLHCVKTKIINGDFE